MTKILIINQGNLLNKGSGAILNSALKKLGEFIHDADFTVFSFHPELFYGRCNVKVLDAIGRVSVSSPFGIFRTLFFISLCSLWSVLHKYLDLNVNILINEKRLQEYANADIIINMSGDSLTEDYGSPFSHFSNFLFAILLNKSIVIYAESIGPFKKKWNILIAKFIFNRIKLITLRDEISKKHLQEIGVNNPTIYVTADSAFLLESAPRQTVREILLKEGINKNNEPIIGISVSQIISRYGFSNTNNLKEKYDKYVRLMARVVDYLVDTLNATVVFVPHVIAYEGNDDRIIAKEIYQVVKHKHKVILITNEYTPEEVKGLIGECDLFIGARMHAVIDSTSMHVPTIAIAYSHKTYGIVGKMLNQEKWICDIKTLDFNTLISKINDAWSNREEIQKDLRSKVEVVKERALLNAKLVKELMSQK